MTYDEFVERLVASRLDPSSEYWSTEEKVVANYDGDEQISQIYSLASYIAEDMEKGWEYAWTKIK